MSGKFTKRGSEAGAQTPPLLRASSPLKPKINRELNTEIGTANGGTSVQPLAQLPQYHLELQPNYRYTPLDS